MPCLGDLSARQRRRLCGRPAVRLACCCPQASQQKAHQQGGTAQSAANAARVEAGREGLEAHVLEMLQATCSAKGKWNVKAAHAAHLQQGGGMSQQSFSLAAGRLMCAVPLDI